MMTKNILLMNVNWLGDVLFSTPAIKALKRESEGGRIYVLIHPRCLQMLENNPNIDELIIYDEDGIHKGIFGKLKLIRELKRKNIEVAYLLHRSFTRALIAYLSGIPKRVGYFYKKRSIFLTDNIKLKDVRKVHRADFYLGVLEGSGIKVTEQDKKIEFYINDEDRLAVAGILKKEGIGDTEDIIVLNPGANWLPKRWSAENFASLADNLIEQYSKRLIISGSKNDQGLVDEIASLMKNTSINLSGKTNLKQLAALFEKPCLLYLLIQAHCI